MQVNDIYDFLDKLAPFESALSFDNCGLLVGNMQHEVKTCVIALDMTKNVFNFALENKADLIVTHHPVIFEPLKSVTSNSIVYDLIKADISVISSHTNLDLAKNGVNDALANILELKDIRPFENDDGIGRVGDLQEKMTPVKFALYIKNKLNSQIVNYTDCGYAKEIKTVAIVSGEGSDYLYNSLKYDAYLTGEVKHHIYSYAQNAKIQLFTAGHYYTEAVILHYLKEQLEKHFSNIRFIVYEKFDIKSV